MQAWEEEWKLAGGEEVPVGYSQEQERLLGVQEEHPGWVLEPQVRQELHQATGGRAEGSRTIRLHTLGTHTGRLWIHDSTMDLLEFF